MTGGFWSPHILFAELFDQLISFVFADTRPHCHPDLKAAVEHSTHCYYSNANKLLWDVGLLNFFLSFDYKHGSLQTKQVQPNTETFHEKENRSDENDVWWWWEIFTFFET